MNRKIIGGIALLIVILCGVGLFVWIQHDRAERAQIEHDVVDAEALRKQLPPTNESAQEGHVHADGTFHADEQSPDPMETASPEWTPAQVQIPEGITDPDVAAAWERLDYISKNIWDWGGTPTPRATELINRLMPPPDGFEGEHAHDDVEVTIDLIDELGWLNDPRAAETLATYACEGIIGGEAVDEALIRLGPPAVPYLIPYLDPPYGYPPSAACFALGRIGKQYREDLDGVIEHIIIPKLEKYVVYDGYGNSRVNIHAVGQLYAEESLNLLKN